MAGLEVLTVNKGLELSQPEQIPWNTVTLTPSGVDSLFVTKPDSYPSASPALIALQLALRVPPWKWKVPGLRSRRCHQQLVGRCTFL